MEALGRLFNIAAVVAPVDLSGGAQTGARVHLRDGEGVAFVYFADAGTDGEDVDLDVQEHNASSAGTSQDLDVVTRWFSKREATLDNDEQWTKHTQTAASEVDLGDDEGQNQVLAVVEVSSKSLSDGYEWVSVNTTDPGATAGKLGCVLAIVYDLTVQRSPELLADLL
ncbi:hypothetical protein ACQEVF_25310 [Nonomuraea polychroma]|uniref:hypothetical protein n=1 Tax=Nonomuraea polychroma TaxID=46176 RepID=UPI003D8B3273